MHGLKGQLGAIGLREFAETADQVAVRIKNEQLDDLLPVLDEFVDELGSVFRAIEQETTQDQHVRPRAQLGTEPQ
jgi:HPt (histidine-containing phosphotransfer) domain-containing protein